MADLSPPRLENIPYLDDGDVQSAKKVELIVDSTWNEWQNE